LAVLFVGLSTDEPDACEGWAKSNETQFAVICYSDEKDLHSFTRSISKSFFSFDNPEKSSALVSSRVDSIAERVISILDMYPPNLRFYIYLYPTRKEYEKAFMGIGALNIFEKVPLSLYLHKNKAIYVSLENITANIFAHEVAHAVINSYFPIPPPAAMQEILAQYVDKHLWDK